MGKTISDVSYMMEQWNYERNTNVDPAEIPVNRRQPQYYWKCRKCSYEWEASPNARFRSTGQCPCCEQNKVVVPGINDMLTKYPEAAESFDYEANPDIQINYLSAGSKTLKVNWKCKKCGYKWSTSVPARAQSGFKCPCCDSNKRIVKGVNDVLTIVSGLSDYYDSEKNHDYDIYSKGVSCEDKIYWKCPTCERSWKSSIIGRIEVKDGNYTVKPCPHYNTEKRYPSTVPFISDDPKIYIFWDSSKNTLDPTCTRTNSTDLAFWKCKKCGYEWSATIRSRDRGSGQCPCCDSRSAITKGINDIFTLVPEAMEEYDFSKNKNIDVDHMSTRSTVPVWWKCKTCGREWQSSFLSRIVGKEGSYKLRRCQQCYLRDNMPITPVAKFSKLICFWDFTKNKELGLDVNLTSAYSDENAWWRCKKCGYEWSTNIRSRTNAPNSCPCCDSKRAVKKGFNDILTIVPDLAKIYDFQRNGDIDLQEQGVNSRIVAKFACAACGHKWDSALYNRVHKENDGSYRLVGCPVCDNRALRKQTYAEQYPELVEIFVTEKNDCSLADVKSTESNTIKYWWKCKSCERFFQSRVHTMIIAQKTKTKGCPYCSRNILIPGESFADIHPDYLDEFSPDNTIDPYTVFPNNPTSVNWRCKNNENHHWTATFALRHAGMGKCPVCTRSTPVLGENTFADVYPDLVSLWSPDNEKTPQNTFFDASIWIKWICPICNQQYRAPIDSVVSNENPCPYCNDRKALPGFNSLADKYPEIAKLWSPNNEKPVDHVLPTLGILAAWVCPNCHGEYNAPVNEIVAGTYDCPYCNDRRALPGFNSLAARHPYLLKEWSYLNNYLIADPDQILPNNTSTLVWWCCPKNQTHIYSMTPAKRLMFQKRKQEPCLYCKGLRRKKRHFV